MMLYSKRLTIIVTLSFVLVVIMLGWWASRQSQAPAAVSSPAPLTFDESIAPGERSVNSTRQVSVTEENKTEETSVFTTSTKDTAGPPLAPGEVSEAEIIAEGLTPELLDAELNPDGDALYHNRIEYSIAPVGIQGPPGDPNRP